MGRGKGAPRKDPSDPPMITRRPLMDILSSPPPLPKRLRHSPSSFPPPLPRFLYSPGRHLNLSQLRTPTRVQVHISAEHLTSSHPALQSRQLWGCGPYTDDSDLVAVVAHSGRYVLPSVRHRGLDFLRVVLCVTTLDAPRPFPAAMANGVWSRYWGDAFQGAAIDVEEVEEVYEETPRLITNRAPVNVLPVTGLAQLSREDKKRMPGDVRVTYDLTNEPCVRYAPRLVCTIDTKPPPRMEKDVLYLENDADRYEIAKVGDTLSFSRVKHNVLVRITVAGIGLDEKEHVRPPCSFPMHEDDVDRIATGVRWSEFFWNALGFTFRKRYYRVTKCFFRKITPT